MVQVAIEMGSWCTFHVEIRINHKRPLLIQFVYALLDLTFILLTKEYTPWRLKVEAVSSPP